MSPPPLTHNKKNKIKTLPKPGVQLPLDISSNTQLSPTQASLYAHSERCLKIHI